MQKTGPGFFRQIWVFQIWVGLLLFAGPAPASDAERLRLIPFPKDVRPQAGEFRLIDPLVIEVSGLEREAVSRLLNAELKRAGLAPVPVRALEASAPAFRLAAGRGVLSAPSAPAGRGPEAYALNVRADGIECAAGGPAGLFYGLQTLCQLIRANRRGDALPALEMRDWPSLRWRGFQDDLTRGPSSTLDTLKFEASMGASLKLNLMTFYMEYQFAFRKHPKIGPADGSLTADELSALVEFAKPLHLDILGNQQSFGHFGRILRHPEYASLRETDDVLSPVREGTYQLLDDLYSEVCPRLPFPWFNVCCDETWGLGTGPSRELAAKIGVGGVYVGHIRRVHDLLRDRYGKRMMMWGDIILQHPGHLADVPRDTLMLTWGYDARASFEDQIVPFAKSGFEFFVCPGVNNWSRILPDFGVAVTNIQHFVRDGVKHGALGMINTDWEDDGEAINAVKWHADAWAAECAWNASATPLDTFNRRVGAVLFGEPGDHFGRAVELLTRTHRLPGMEGMFNTRFWRNDFTPTASSAAIQSTASNLLAVVRPALEHLEACRRDARCNEQVLEAFRFGARRMELIGRRMLDGLEAAQLCERAFEAATQGTGQTTRGAGASAKTLEQVADLVRRNRDAHGAMGREFAVLWRSECKPYALDWTLARYTNTVNTYDRMLRRVNDARAAVLNGRPMPSPEDLGLAIPKPLSRRVRPPEILTAPLAPDAPWAEPNATHRLGMVVRAGEADRHDLPVEVELTLPADLAARPARAFVLDSRETPLEVLTQLDPLEPDKKWRLIVMLPGVTRQGTERSVHVYLGLTDVPSALPGAVRTEPAANGMQRIENNRVRLLLGSEGAHVYRWELKEAANRDLTMPGDADWAGFSDMATHRHSRYRLDRVARGPAMVEFQCLDPGGHTKSLRLYGNASWLEIFLGEPTPIYWDFDDPKNFAGDGPTPGTWLFSNGRSGPVGREADGVPAQVKARDVFWGIKSNADRLALGIVTPETAAHHHIAPGAGAGGVGIESSPPARHFVTFAGLLQASPAETMNRLQTTLSLKHPVEVRLHSIQVR